MTDDNSITSIDFVNVPACIGINESQSFEPPHILSPDISSFNGGELSPIPKSNRFNKEESIDSCLYKSDSFEKPDESPVHSEKSEKSPDHSNDTSENETPEKKDHSSPQISDLSPVYPGYDQFQTGESPEYSEKYPINFEKSNEHAADESSVYPDESLVLIDKYPIVINKSPAAQTEPSANEDSPVTVMESPVRLKASNHHDHSTTYQSPIDVSRSYVISDDGSHHIIDNFDEPTDHDIDVSKSYIVSEKTETDNGKRNGNVCLSDIVESRDSDLKVALGETQSLNMVPDSLEVHKTLQVENLAPSNVINDNDESEDDEPPSLKSIKSIAERKKQKLLERQKEKESKSETPKNETSSNTEEGIANIQNDRETVKKVNRYSTNNESTPNVSRISRPTKRDNRPERLKVQKKIPSKKMTFMRAEVKPRNQTPRKDDKIHHDFKQLQILIEKERKNNLKMYQDMIASQNKWKVEKQKLCSEYEKKISELNKNINVLKKKQKGASDIKSIDNDDIVEKLEKQLQMQETMISGFQEENKSLYDKLKQQEVSQKNVEDQNEDEKKKLAIDIDSLKMNHLLEIEKLEKKVKWYAENQVLLDNDVKELKEGRETIRAQNVSVNQLELEIKKLKHENLELKKEVSRKENLGNPKPNILPTNEPTQSNPLLSLQKISNPLETSIVNEKEKPLTLYLEKRIKILENELEEKDNDNSRRIRAIEQKYSSVTLEFEDQIKKLESRMDDLILENASLKELGGNKESLERLKNEHSIEILDLKNEMSVYEEEIHLLKSKLNEAAKKDDGEKLAAPMNQKLNDQHKKKLKAKDVQINELAEKVMILDKDRKLLTEELQSNLNAKEFGKTYRRSPSNTEMKKDIQEIEEKYLSSVSEIKRLKAYIDEFQIESEQRRLRYEAIDAKSQSEIRTLTEKFEEEKSKCDENYKRVIEKLKVDFAVEHSNSRVAELSAKVSGLELMVDHMKFTLDETRVEKHKFIKLKNSEDSLQQKINELQKELVEAQNIGTPGVQEYKMLVSKISSMERNHYSREEKLKTIIESTKCKAVTDMEDIEEKWRVKVRQKDGEIHRFREELDGIIEVLEALQKQGVVLPKYDVT